MQVRAILQPGLSKGHSSVRRQAALHLRSRILLQAGSYGNKLLIKGFLGHLKKPDLLPLLFDDLAEVHRAGGVPDDLPSPPSDTVAAEDERSSRS